MREIVWLMKKIISVTFRKRRNLFLFFGLPLIGIFIAFLAYGPSGQDSLKIGVVNGDQQQIANDTVHFLESLQNVRVEKINEAEVNDKIAAGTLDCAITIPQGFSKSILAGKPENLQIVSIKGSSVTSFVKSYLYMYLDNITSIRKAADGNSAVFEKMYMNYQQDHFKLTVHSLKDTSYSKAMTYQSIGYLVMIMLFSAGNFSGTIISEKENRTYFRLLSTPISSRQYVLSNIAVNLLVMLVQVSITIFFMKDIFHIQTNVSYWQFAVVMMLFSLTAAGLSLMLVSFAGNSASFGALQNLVVTPTSLLAGCFWPVEIMPKAVQKIADFLPQRWALDTISKLQQGNQLGSLYLNLLILLAFAAAFFLVAVYKFGKNNSVRNIV